MDYAKYGPVLEFVRLDIRLHLKNPRCYERPRVALEIFRYLYGGGDRRFKGTERQSWLNYFDRQCPSISHILVGTRPFLAADALALAEAARREITQILPNLGIELATKYPQSYAVSHSVTRQFY